MKKLMAVLLGLACVGCDYTVPLVTSPQLPIDRQLVGLWERVDGGGPKEQLLVLPSGKCEYSITCPVASTNGMVGRACLAQAVGKMLVQIEWLGTTDGSLPENERVYQYASYAIKGAELEVRLISGAVVSKDVKTAADLTKSLEANKDKQDLFCAPMTFKKLVKVPAVDPATK